jgi:electron transfer flavoprotein alpha subunit
MNCTEFDSSFNGTQPLKVVRARWGGSLLEQAEVDAPIKLVTLANHTVEPTEAPTTSATNVVDVQLDPSVLHSIVRDRVERVAGVTLATAPVVVSGGRGVGSAEAFAPLEELAALLGGVVGCSRAVTNNGWRNHTDQVGQTGTRIAPDIYIACGISGAIQHWVGAMASKNILAINLDQEANIVTKSGYAVIGDLHKVVPAVSAEIRRRRGL